MSRLVRKDNPEVAIVGTLERVLGTCGLEGATRKADGTLQLEYGFGGTELNWDSAETVVREGRMVFIDENGEEATEDEVMLDDATYDLHGRRFGIAAEFTDTDEGTKAANAFMAANPETGLLAVADGRVIVAQLADKGRAL